MAYENKTVDYVYNLLIESFQEKFNNKLRLLPKSFIVILSKVLSVIFVLPYKVCGWFYLQLFPDTASFDRVNVMGISLQPLVKLGVNIGVGEPTSGQAWEGLVSATVVTEGPSAPSVTAVPIDSGDLGGEAPPVLESGKKDRPFCVKGKTFANAGAAVQRACDIQFNKCADAANADQLDGKTIQDCEAQKARCGRGRGRRDARR